MNENPHAIPLLIQRAKAAIDEFEQANTPQNFYLMTDGGEAIAHAEDLVSILRDFLVTVGDAETLAFHTQFADKVKHYIGKRVRILLDEEKPVITGKLLGWGTGGTLEILEDDGDLHYCWPLLKIEEATDGR